MKKTSPAGLLQHNSPQPRSLEPSTNNPFYQNATHSEQVPLISEISPTSIVSLQSSCNPFHDGIDHSLAVSVNPDDAPSYPPPDYASAGNYPSLSSDEVPPPDYATAISSNATFPCDSIH